MKDNMTETLAARPEEAQCDISSGCQDTHTHTDFTHTFRHACKLLRVSSNTVKTFTQGHIKEAKLMSY